MQLLLKRIPKHAQGYLALLSFNILIIGFVLFSGSKLPPQVPLLYGRAVSDEQLVDKTLLVLPAVSAALVTVINALLSFITTDQFIRRILIGTSVVSALLSVITTVRIMLLVGSF